MRTFNLVWCAFFFVLETFWAVCDYKKHDMFGFVLMVVCGSLMLCLLFLNLHQRKQFLARQQETNR